MTRTRTRIAAATLAVSALFATPIATASATPEDSPAWDCRTDGNRICGVANDQGVPAGCYSDTGALVAAWPCSVVVNADGSSDVSQ